MAMATNDPNAPKGPAKLFKDTEQGAARTPGNLPPHVWQRPVPQWSGAHPTMNSAPVSGQLNKVPTQGCSTIEYDCGAASYLTPTADGYGAAVRYSTGGEDCAPQSVDFAFYASGTTAGNTSGIDVEVYADDGTGLPGAVLFTVHVPDGDIVYYSSVLTVDLTPGALSFPAGTDYHVGFRPTDPAETYGLLFDDGSCGQGRSSFWYGPASAWFPSTAVLTSAIDFNWVEALDVCCSAPVPTTCETVSYYGPGVYAYWFDAYAVRYQADPNALQCQVTTVNFWVEDPAPYTGDALGYPSFGGVDAYVYADDGSGLPGVVLGTIFVDHASLVASAFNTVDFTTQGLTFPPGTDFHVGWGAAVLYDEYFAITDDAGAGASPPGSVQSSLYDDASGTWTSTIQFNIDNGYGPADDNLLIDAELCCEPNPIICENISYAGPAYYYWADPDAYGDTYRNERFSLPTNAGPVCTLKTVSLAFDGSGSVGGPGANIYIWNSDGNFPSTVINTAMVNPITDFFPVYTSVDVSALNLTVNGDWHVGYSTIDNSGSGTDVLAILSDDGSTGAGRSSEYWTAAPGGADWFLFINSWAVDVDFLIETDVCCVPPGYCPITCSPTDQWPAFNHDFARTGQSELTLGDLCGVIFAWNYTAPSGINFSSPVIVDDVILQPLDDRVQGIDLLSGSVIWDTSLLGGGWTSTFNTGLRGQITVQDGYFYIGTGTLRGFAKGDLYTGAFVWGRGLSAPGGPLPGASNNTRFAGSVIMGSEIYFGNEAGEIYALDIASGASLYNTNLAAAAPTNGGTGAIYGAPSSDGSQIFWAITENLFSPTTQNGAIVSTSQGAGSFVVNWVYKMPFDGVLNLGPSGGSSYRCENVYIHPSFAFGNYAGYSGLRKKLDAATGAAVWPDNFLMGAAWYNPPSTSNEIVYYGQQDDNFSQGDPSTRGVRAVNFNNSTVWLRGDTDPAGNPFDPEVFASVSVTCDPYAIYTTTDGISGYSDWLIVDGNTGGELIKYTIPTVNIAHYTAIASGSDGSPYFVVSRGGFSPAGELFAWKIGGPRPRLSVPSTLVYLPGTNDQEAAPVQRTAMDAIVNTGCATLTYGATLEAGTPPAKRINVSSVHPDLVRYADNLSNQIVDVTVEQMLGRNTSYFTKNMKNVSIEKTADHEVANRVVYEPKVSASSSRQVLAPPTWVTWVNPPSGGASVSGSLTPGDGADWTWEFDRSGMNFLAPNTFYVEVSSDDPDYLLQTPADDPRAVIEYRIPYEYCPVETGFMNFGTTGQEWYSNRGEIGDANVAQDFSIDVGGAGDDYLYEGTMFFMTSMDDAAWNLYGSTVPTDFGFLYPFYVGAYANQDCGGCDFGVSLPVEYTTDGGNTYANTQGDLCTFAMIDSLQGAGIWPQQAGPAMGLRILYREVGTYGADFDGFKVIVADIENRNASALNGLYYGCFIDWDIGTDGGFADPAKGYQYQIDPSSGDIDGVIGLPQAGSYWPDGTKTDPMYNARTIDNATSVYPSAAICPDCILDSLYAWVDGLPEGAFYYEPDDPSTVDKSSLTAFGKTDLAGNAIHSYGFALYGIFATADPNGATEDMAAFINKYVGFGRGDINNDGVIDLRDLVRLSNYVANGTAGPVPFLHLGDVNNDGVVDGGDCSYLAAYYFMGGPPPQSAFVF
jgi:hypothetical protein